VNVQLGGEQVEQPDTVDLDETAFHLRHPALSLAERGGEVGLRNAQPETGPACAAADLLSFLQHQHAPRRVGGMLCSSVRQGITAPSVQAHPSERYPNPQLHDARSQTGRSDAGLWQGPPSW
jgi:hypothetical protein